MSKKKANALDLSEDLPDSNDKEDPVGVDEKPTFSNGWIIFVAILLIIFLLFGGMVGYQRYAETRQYAEQDFYTLYQKTLDGVETENNFMYNGYVFVNMSGLWQTIFVQKRFYENRTDQREVFLTTHYNPTEVETIPLNEAALASVVNSTLVYMSYPANLSQDYVLAGVEVGKVLGTKNGILNKPVIQSVHGQYNGSYPVIDCMNASSSRIVVKFMQGNSTSVSYENNCVIVQGNTSEDVIKSADRLLFTLIGIMNP